MCYKCPYAESTSETALRNKRNEAKQYAIEYGKTIIIYRTQEGFSFSEEESFYENKPGQYIEHVSCISANAATG